MASKLRDLKDVGGDTENLVFGFCRKIFDILPSDNVYYSIQDTIINICIAFYWIRYKWWQDFIDGDKFKFEDNIAIKLNLSHGHIFLDNIMSSDIYKYSFRIIGNNSLRLVDGIIGIVSDNVSSYYAKQHGWGKPFILEDTAYAFATSKAIKSGCGSWSMGLYGKICKDGDIVTMIVDLVDMKLIYEINGDNQGIAYYNIKPGIYRTCVYLYSPHSQIELLD